MQAVLTRIAFAGALVVCFGLTGPQLVRHIAWGGLQELSDEVLQGRVEVSDLELLVPVLARPGPETCWVLRETPIVFLHLYANELVARQAGVNPFFPADDLDLSSLRKSTRTLLEDALACSPMDGNNWLSLAVLSRAMDDPPDRTARFVAMSERYAPHEGWIAIRRDQLF